MTVDGLKPGTTYVFRVRARTDGGYGSYGGEIELETSHEGKEVKNKHLFTRDLSFSLFFFFLLFYVIGLLDLFSLRRVSVVLSLKLEQQALAARKTVMC